MSLVQLELDEKDKENFQELQQSIGHAQGELQMLAQKLRTRNAEEKHALLTLAELQEIPDETRTYEQVGKMFILQPLPDVIQKLVEQTETCKKEVAAMTEKKATKEEEFKKLNEDFQEFVKAHVVEAKEEGEGEGEKKKKKEIPGGVSGA